jgi:hypothetical protein
MNHLLEEYEVESVEELYNTIVLGVMVGAPIGAQIYQDIVKNNLTESFENWYKIKHTEYLSITELRAALTQLNPTA